MDQNLALRTVLLPPGCRRALRNGSRIPGGDALHRALLGAYDDLEPLRFLRTSYKAAPLVAVALAGLGGVAVHALWHRSLAAARRWPRWGLPLPWLVAAGSACVIVVFGLPLFTGQAIDRTQAYGQVPKAWRAGLADAGRHPANQRMMVVPGALFGSYRWGQTVSSIAPALARRPVLVRELVPYASPEAAQLQTTVDNLIQQGRLVPGQLDPLLALMAVGQVIVDADLLHVRSASWTRGAGPALEDSVGSIARRPPTELGATSATSRASGALRFGSQTSAGTRRRRLRARALCASSRAMEPPCSTATQDGIAQLAANRRLSTMGAVFYGADLDRESLLTQTQLGTTLVFTDSNRRRVMEPNLLRANVGPTLEADDPIAPGWPSYGVFRSSGTATQTVARYTRTRLPACQPRAWDATEPVRAPVSALDGRLNTAWRVPPASPTTAALSRSGLPFPRSVATLRIYPAGGVSRVTIAVNRGTPHAFRVQSGWNVLRIGGRRVRSLRFAVPASGGAGISEIRIDGLRVREALRLPTELADRARGLDLSHSAEAVLLARTTADFAGQSGASGRCRARLVRDVTLPAGRLFRVHGWANVSATATDSQIDRLAGMQRGWSFTSSGRYQALPRHRASSAFDARTSSSWVAPDRPGHDPWLRVRAPRPLRFGRLRLRPGPAGFGYPAAVRLATDGTKPLILRPSPTGEVTLPAAQCGHVTSS